MPEQIHIIITGGLGAGKSNLIERIQKTGDFVLGSPATTMKRQLAKAIARTYNVASDRGWEHFFLEMMDRRLKERYRGILQGYGEHFSNLDNFFWIRRTMEEVQQDIDNIRWAGNATINGTVYDSIRRPSEIIGIRNVFPTAKRIHLDVSPERQLEYLIGTLGYSQEKAALTLAHSSEHWLDRVEESEAPDWVIDANRGDEYIWRTFQQIFDGREADRG